MNVLDFYNDRMEEVTFNGQSDKVLALRRGKSMSPTTIADGKVFCSHIDTPIKNGDMITRPNGDRYFIIAKQSSGECIQMQGRRINAEVKIYELVDEYVNRKKVGTMVHLLWSDVPVYYVDVSAAMNAYDAGLLPTTVKKLIIEPSMDVKLFHRIELNGKNYQVNSINTGKYVGLLEVQVGEDTRQ